jgi:hypothetical protein
MQHRVALGRHSAVSLTAKSLLSWGQNDLLIQQRDKELW